MPFVPQSVFEARACRDAGEPIEIGNTIASDAVVQLQFAEI
jgi:hypothetical protein